MGAKGSFNKKSHWGQTAGHSTGSLARGRTQGTMKAQPPRAIDQIDVCTLRGKESKGIVNGLLKFAHSVCKCHVAASWAGSYEVPRVDGETPAGPSTPMLEISALVRESHHGNQADRTTLRERKDSQAVTGRPIYCWNTGMCPQNPGSQFSVSDLSSQASISGGSDEVAPKNLRVFSESWVIKSIFNRSEESL